jgi:hypothetical protein
MEATLAENLQIVGDMGQMQRTAGPGYRNVCHQLQLGFARRHDERQEHVVLPLKGEDTVGSQSGNLSGALAHLLRRPVNL